MARRRPLRKALLTADLQRFEQLPAGGGTLSTRGFPWGRSLAIVAVVTMILFWLWIFSGAPAKDDADRLQDRAYVTRLEDRCQRLRADIEELPSAAGVSSPAERDAALDDANVLVSEFIADLAAGAPSTGDAAVSIAGWRADWEKYLANREDYAKRLRNDTSAQLLLSRSELGDTVDKAIESFSQVNVIPACATPDDIG